MPLVPRIHLFEWEDLRWFPSWLRDCMTDFLEHISRVFKMYQPIPEILEKELKAHDTNTILDLGSGGGGPWRSIIPEWQQAKINAEITLSDYYPNKSAFEKIKAEFPEYIQFESASVDARNVSVKSKSVRTQFLSLHHFRPNDATAIFKNAVESGNPIVIVEGQKRSIPSMIGMIFSPINALLMTPFIRPFRLDRIVFTYLIPILPLLIMWDGCVSVLRTYSESELQKLASKADTENKYVWEYANVGKGGLVYTFIGRPKS